MSSVFLHFFLFLFSYTLFSAKQIYKKNTKNHWLNYRVYDYDRPIKVERRRDIMNIFKPLTDLAYIVLIIMFVMIFFFVFGCFVFWFLKNLFKK